VANGSLVISIQAGSVPFKACKFVHLPIFIHFAVIGHGEARRAVATPWCELL